MRAAQWRALMRVVALSVVVPPNVLLALSAPVLLVTIGLAWVVLRLVRRVRVLDEGEAERDRLDSLFDHAVDPMVLVDREGRVQRVNQAFVDRHSAMAEDVIGRPLSFLFSAGSRGSVLGGLRSALEGSTRKCEASFVTGASTLDVELATAPTMSRGEYDGACVSVRDITDRKHLEAELHARALHDYLTGLPNRALFQDRLEHALSRISREARSVALIYMDLDRFKPVNDRLGHEVGDRVLEVVASRLGGLVRSGDTVSRVGGDEFAILLEGVESSDEVLATAKRVLAALREDVVVKGVDELICIGASIGVALSNTDLPAPSDLVRRADLAMYEAKKRGGFQTYEYHPELEEEADGFSERVEADLRRAISLGELHLVYQPIIDVDGERMMGLEALVRWTHPELGEIYPSQFIPIAEQSSLIADIDRWVLENACLQTRELLAGDETDPGLLLSVNLSARHFSEPDFIESVSNIILRTNVDPDRLQLELTETAAGGDADRVRRLKALGVKVAIDDFGSGYSSLGYLRDLDVDVLKVDRSFVLALGADPSSVAIVRTIITLAEILELEVIIEGIEDAVQLGHLEELGGRYVQGYLWGRPLDIAELRQVLVEGVSRSETAGMLDEGTPQSSNEARRPYLAPVGGRPEGVTDLNRAQNW